MSFGTPDRMHSSHQIESAAYASFLDDVVLTLVASPAIIISDALPEDDPRLLGLVVEAAQRTFFFDYPIGMCQALLSSVIPKLAGLAHLEVRLAFDDGTPISSLQLHDLGLRSLRVFKACSLHFKEPNARNWRVTDLYLDQVCITDATDDNLDAIAIPRARQFHFVERVVVDMWPDLDNYNTEADMRTALAALFPFAASACKLTITNTERFA